MWSLNIRLIKGCMFGIEYGEDPEEHLFYIVLDLGILRFLYTKYSGE